LAGFARLATSAGLAVVVAGGAGGAAAGGEGGTGGGFVNANQNLHLNGCRRRL